MSAPITTRTGEPSARRRRLLRGAAVAAVGTALIATGCSSSPSASSSQQAAPASQAGSSVSKTETALLKRPTSLPVTQQLQAKPKTGIKVAFLDDGLGYSQQYLSGLRAAAQVLGWQVSPLTVNAANPASTPSAIMSAINAGDNYVILAATPAAAYASTLSAARKAHVVIIDFNSANPAVPGVVQPTLSQSWAVYLGSLAGQALAADAASRHVKAVVGDVTVPIYASVTEPIEKGFTEGCTGCSIQKIDIPAENFQSGSTASVIVSYLQSHRTINYLEFDGAGLDSGVAAQLRAAGQGVPEMFGVAPYQPEISAVQNGTETGWSVAPSLVQGWILADTIARASEGMNASVWDQTTPLGYVLEKGNSAGATEENLNFPVDYQSAFKKLWKIS